jgi:hypothetical protein
VCCRAVWDSPADTVPAPGGHAAEPARLGPDDLTLLETELGNVPLRLRPGLPGQRVGALCLGHGGLGVVRRECDRLLEMPVRLGQPRPRGRADAAAPRGDEVPGGRDGTARHQHDLVQHRPRPVLPIALRPGAGQRAVESRIRLLDLTQRRKRVEWRARLHLVAGGRGRGVGTADHGRAIVRPAGRRRRGLGDLHVDLAQRGREGRGGLGKLGLHVLDPVEQRLRLVRRGLGCPQEHRHRAGLLGFQRQPHVGQGCAGELEPLAGLAGTGGHDRHRIGGVLVRELGKYPLGGAEARGLLRHVMVHLGENLGRACLEILQAVKRRGLLIE